MEFAFDVPQLDREPTPDEVIVARLLADKLDGCSKDVDQLCEELDLNPSITALRYLDRLVWKCKECEHYCPTLELDADETCFSCR